MEKCIVKGCKRSVSEAVAISTILPNLRDLWFNKLNIDSSKIQESDLICAFHYYFFGNTAGCGLQAAAIKIEPQIETNKDAEDISPCKLENASTSVKTLHDLDENWDFKASHTADYQNYILLDEQGEIYDFFLSNQLPEEFIPTLDPAYHYEVQPYTRSDYVEVGKQFECFQCFNSQNVFLSIIRRRLKTKVDELQVNTDVDPVPPKKKRFKRQTLELPPAITGSLSAVETIGDRKILRVPLHEFLKMKKKRITITGSSPQTPTFTVKDKNGVVIRLIPPTEIPPK